MGREPALAETGTPARVAKTPKPKGLNYRLSDADDIGAGGRAVKVKQNLAAIRLLKELRAADRVDATPDEQATLAKYVGWGAFPGYFDPNHKDYLTPAAKELREALTPEEYAEARSSTQNAHYTSPEVVKAMWRIMDRFGLREGRVLEPSMGVGNFVGFAPTNMDLGWVGVEKDPTTGYIAKYLYPESQIYVSGYEDVALRNGSVDVAIGNVPFGQISVYDPKYKHLKGFSIHDYFFAKTLDKVRPGGIIAFITSRHTMDKVSETVRKYIADRADLVGAIRLPNTAFKGNAGTEVVTDLIMLRVRAKGAAPAGESWMNLERVPVGDDDEAPINEYYARHPEMMLGELAFTRGQFSDHDLVLKPHQGAEIAAEIDGAAARLPANALLPDARPVAGAQQMAVVEAPANSQAGTYLVHEGKVAQVGLDGTLIDAQVPKAQDAKVRQLIGLRDQARALVKLNTDAGTPDAAIEKARQALEKSYKVFTKAFGPVNLEKRSTGVNKNGVAWTRTSYPNRDIIDDDPDLAQVLALEHYDSATDKATPADLITKGRIIPPAEPITSADTGFDAVVASLGKFGRLDLDYMAELRGVSVDALKTELKGDIFENPASGDWEIKAKYLSGNVRDKLVEAKRAAKNDARFRENVASLEKVVPPDLPASAIRVRFGARWIKPAEYGQFIANLLGGEPGDVAVQQDEHTGLWEVNPGSLAYSVANQRTYGIGKMSATDIIQSSMNSKSLRITTTVKTDEGTRTYPDKESTALALAKQNEILEKFRNWLFTEDAARGEKLVRRYNDEYNNIVPPKFEGKFLTVPGTATHIVGRDFTWYEHQKNAIMRFLQNGNILLAHAPGAGKTYTFIAMAMEARRFGLAKRPMIAVPNHMLAQATREAQQLYPGARILALGTDDTSSKAKALLAARAASNEWDLIITTHNAMGRIPMSKAFQTEFLREQLNELRDAMASEESKRNKPGQQRGKSRSVKRLEATIDDYETRLKEMMDAPRDTSMTFEELGADLLIVDEAHQFKNLNFATRVEGIQVGSNKGATQLHMKTQYLHRINPTHGVVFATGTPITNSIAELWTMQRYVNPRGLKERGLERFDDWQAIFGSIVSRMEKNTVGNYEVKSRLAKYVNVPAMIQMFREFADVKTIAELNLPRPPLLGGAFQAVVAPEPDGMKSLLAALREQWEALKKMKPDEAAKSGMSFLSIGNRAKNAGLDMRLVSHAASDEATYKVDLAAAEILQRYATHQGYKGAQVVFLDASVDKGEHAENALGGRHGFSVYAELKRKLIAGGIPAKEIAFSQDADNDAKKKVLFRKVNDGEIRVIVGSTAQMGMGTNMQRRLVALHRLDVPWRPDLIEQSEARILRMGNWLYDTGKILGVEILRYVTEGSYDQYSWDTVLRKARFVAQAMAGDASIAELDEMADESAQGAQLMAAMASNNPLELERAELGQQVAELQAQAQGHRNEQARVTSDIRGLVARLKDLRKEQVWAAEDAKVKVDTRADKFAIALGVTVDRPTITKRPEAGDALLKVLAEVPKGSQRSIGTFGGFPLSAKAVGDSWSVFIESKIMEDVFIQGGQSAVGALAQLEAAMRKIGITENYPRWIAESEQRLKELEQLTGRTFARAAELEKAETRLRDVEAELMKQSMEADKKGETPPPDSEDYGGDVVSEARTTEGRAGMDVNRQGLADTMSANVYQGSLPKIIVKEAIQNAIDAIRPRGKGTITIDLDAKNRRITVSDDGVGMSPQTATGPFLDAFSSEKPEGASGGLGIAKAALFRYGDPFRMETVAELPGEPVGGFRLLRRGAPTRKVRTTIEGTGQDWIDGTLRVHDEEVDAKTPTGTTLSVTIDKAIEDDSTLYAAKRFVEELQRNSRLPEITFKAVRQDKYAPDDIGGIASKIPPKPRLTATIPGGRADVFTSDKPMPYSMGGTYTTAHILNNGYHQFDLTVPFGPNAPELWIDVHADVPVSDPSYPFTIDRGKLKDAAEKAIKESFKSLANAAEAEHLDILIRSLASAPEIRGGGRVYATAGVVTKDMTNRIAARPYASALAAWWKDAGRGIVQAVAVRHGLEAPTFDGIGLGGDYLAVNVMRKGLFERAKELGVDVGADASNLLLFNPFNVILEARAQKAEFASDPEHLADQLWGALVHEIAHQNARGHDEKFAGEFTRIDGRAARVQSAHLPALEELWRTLLAEPDFLADVDALKAMWQSKADTFKGFIGHANLDTQRPAVPGSHLGGADARRDVLSPSRRLERGNSGGAASEAALRGSRQGSSVESAGHGADVRGTDERDRGDDQHGVAPSGFTDVHGVFDPLTAAVRGFQQANALRRQRLAMERVRFPVVRLPSGRIVAGTSHIDALQRAQAAGLVDAHWKPNYDTNDGWATTHRPFVTRETAYAIAEKAEQLREKGGGELTHDSFLPSGGGFKAMGFADPLTAAAHMLYQTKPVQATLGQAAGTLANLSTSVRAIFNPAGLTPAAGHASRIVRAQRGSSDLDVARAHQAIEDVREALDKLDAGANFGGPRWDWYRDMERGDLTHMNAPLRMVAHVFRKLLDGTRDEIRALGPGHLDTVIENYMPRIYKEGPKITGGAQKQVGTRIGKRPFEGPKSFKKKRSFETLDDALAAGYVPISDNPIDMLLLKIREMRRYLMAQRIKNELKADGLIKFKKASRKLPDGYLRLNDGAFTVYAPRGAEGETRVRGEYVAPADVARIINNFLSPGLRGNPIYDSYSWLGNTINMVQLGMSAFHAGFVAFDATVQTAAIGMDQLLTGKGPGGRVGGAGKMLIAGASAATGPLTILPLPAATMSYLRGRKVWHDYFHDASSAEMKQIIDGLTAGGGRAKMDDYYRAGNVDKLKAALRDKRWVKAGLNVPFALIEGSMYPLLEHVVPRMKLGAIYQGLQVELAKLPQGATEDDIRKAAAKVVDSVDARLGQMIYDNKFWHRATKEIMMAGIRSVGWNVGTFDVTLGGAAQAVGNLRPGGPNGGDERDWHKVQYLAALAGLVALYGAVYTYLHTGERPTGWKDYYFPRTGVTDRDGNAERMTPATYMKDIFSMARQGGTLILHKLHPALEAAAETMQNKDFYGDMIHNPDDPFWTRRQQDMQHIVHDVLKPFSIRNAEELTKRGEGAREKVEGFFGNQAAPRAVVRSDAQNKMAELLARHGHPERTPEETATRGARDQLEAGYRQGDVSRDSLRRLVRGRELTMGQAKAMTRRTQENPLVSRFKLLHDDEAKTVYDLGTPEEQKLWAPYMRRKARRLIRPGAPD